MSKNEQPPIYCLRRGTTLVPEMEADAELINRLPYGDRIKIMVTAGRSPSRLRLYWAFLSKVVKATECAPSSETLHELLKLENGFTDPVKLKGYTVLVPKSISFASMSEQEFDDFLRVALRWIEETYGVSLEDVFPEEERKLRRKAA